jgi:hypothetical protein
MAIEVLVVDVGHGRGCRAKRSTTCYFLNLGVPLHGIEVRRRSHG